MSPEPRIRRGDVVLVPMPLVTDPASQKVRPAVVVQNDVGNRFSANVIVAVITSQVPDRDYPTNVRLPRGTAGLDRDGVVLGGTILTLPKAAILRTLGRLDDAQLAALDACLRVSLGLG